MFVVEGLVLAQDVQQVCLVHDQGPVEEFDSAGAHLAFHDSGYTDAGFPDRDAFVGKGGVEAGRIFAVAVALAPNLPVPIQNPVQGE